MFIVEKKTQKNLEAIDNYQEDNMSMVDSLGESIDNSWHILMYFVPVIFSVLF